MHNEVRGGQFPDWPAQSHPGHKTEGDGYHSIDFFGLKWELYLSGEQGRARR